MEKQTEKKSEEPDLKLTGPAIITTTGAPRVLLLKSGLLGQALYPGAFKIVSFYTKTYGRDDKSEASMMQHEWTLIGGDGTDEPRLVPTEELPGGPPTRQELVLSKVRAKNYLEMCVTCILFAWMCT